MSTSLSRTNAAQTATGVTRAIPVPGRMLCGLTFAQGLLWFSDGALHRITAVDPSTGDVVRAVACPAVTTGLTTLRGNLVQVVGREHSLCVIDLDGGSELEQLPNPRPGHELCGIEAGPDGIWMGYEDLRVLDLRSLDGLELLDCIPVEGKVAGVTIARDHVAYADHEAARVRLVDPETRVESASIEVDGNPTGMTWDGTRLWYCDFTSLQLRAVEASQLAWT